MKKLCVFLVLLFTAFDLCAQQTNTQKTTAAVMDLEAKEGVSAGVAASLSDYLRVQLINTQKFDIVTRENMEEVLKEQKFQLSGCTSRECVVQVGQLLGVRRMFAGVITKIGATYVVTLKIIDVESGKIGKAETEECAKCEEDALLVSMRNIANKIAGLPVQSGVVSQAVQPVPAGISGAVKEVTWEKDGSIMVLVPEGEFTMGSNESDDEKPPHKVYIDAYYIDKYEVTNQQFKRFVDETGYKTDAEKGGGGWVYDGKDWKQKFSASWKDPFGDGVGISNKMSHPVVQVSWNDAVAYAKWAGKRLPTEAEWEKAARGADGRKYPWGNEWNGKNCNFADRNTDFSWSDKNVDDGYKYLAPVGSYPAGASPYGVMDMAGNVWEWCSDWYDKNYYKNSPSKNPQGPSAASARVIRGGSWLDVAVFCRSANRDRIYPGIGWIICGVRCAASRGE